MCECGVVLLVCRALYRQFVAETILNPHKFEGGNDGTLIDHVSRIVCVVVPSMSVVTVGTTMYMCVHVYDMYITFRKDTFTGNGSFVWDTKSGALGVLWKGSISCSLPKGDVNNMYIRMYPVNVHR